jgi:hypothetical protein
MMSSPNIWIRQIPHPTCCTHRHGYLTRTLLGRPQKDIDILFEAEGIAYRSGAALMPQPIARPNLHHRETPSLSSQTGQG